MMRARMMLGLTAVLAVAAVLTLVTSLAVAQDAQSLPIGQAVSGEVANRLGEEWTFEACAGDVVTVTLTSDDFATFLELYAPDGRDPIASDDAGASGSDAEIAGFELADAGVHTVVAAGSGILDRGPYSLTLIISGTTDLAELGASILSDTVPVTGVVSTRLGDEWLFRGCASQAVTLTMQSDEFAPVLELYNSTDREPLSVGAQTEVTTTVQISGFVLPRNDLYAVIAAGASVRDRGSYTLSLAITETEALTATAGLTPTDATTRLSNPGSAVIPVPTAVSPAPDASEPTCSVVGASLNLRPGPGTEFDPPIGALLQGAALRPLSRNQDASWVEVEVLSNGRQGWVSSAPDFIACNIDVSTLQPGIIPPTPTATNTPLPTATPRPTATPLPTATTDPFAGLPSAAGVVVASPGGTGDLEGNVYTNPQIVDGTDAQNDTPIFREFFYLEAFAFDPNIPGASNRSGAGIDRVEFRMECPNGAEYENTEVTPRYCLFGGGEPSCSVLRLVDGATIPGSQCRIENDFYRVFVDVFPENRNLAQASWNLEVLLEPPGSGQAEPEPDPDPQEPPEGQPQEPPQDSAELFAQFVRTGIDTNGDSFSGALVFQVQAYDPNVGGSDGAGIAYVDLVVARPDGSPVYGKRENDAAYCAFGGDEPCPAFVFADNNYQWPGGAEFTPGPYRLLAQVTADDGSSIIIERTVNIQ